MVTLRRFLYLDSGAVGDYLSSILGGVPEGTIDTTGKGGSGFSAGGKLGPAELRGSRDNQQEERRTLRITDEARFQQLFSLLEGRGEIQELGAFDPAITEQFRRGEVLEIDAEVAVSGLHKALHMSGQLSGWLDVADKLGLDLALPDAGGLDARSALGAMDQISTQVAGQPIPITFMALDTPDVMFGSLLRRDYLRVDLTELEGEAIVFGTVHRVIATGERHVLWSPMGSVGHPSQSAGNRAERRRAEKLTGKKKAIQPNNQLEAVVVGPAVILTPVAVFR